jgi:pimeloyl-CoA synthetase
MNDNKDFILGFFAGAALVALITVLSLVFYNVNENSGYKDKMIIEYHCPGKEYERKLIHDLVNNSGIQTNFVNKECTMNKWGVKYRLTNPNN